MTHIGELFDLDALNEEIGNGFVQTRRHPTLPLTIYTYTRHCQYDRHWTFITRQCRGLVVADDGEVVAWPFPKFFNVTEHDTGQPYAPPLPNEPFSIFEKMDGSLGIVFFYDDKWHVASKGSFTSEQAEWANRYLDRRNTAQLNPDFTYLCEIIYPENRIVVRYDGHLTGLCLLGAYNRDGEEVPLHQVQRGWEPVGYLVKQWVAHDQIPLSSLLTMAASNTNLNGTEATGTDEEGWVIRYEPSGIRAKIKFGEYMRLHKVLTGVNARDIWKAYGADRFHDIPTKTLAVTIGVSPDEAARLAAIPGGAMRPLLENVPDEFDEWARKTMADLDAEYHAVTQDIADLYEIAMAKTRDEDPGYGDNRRAVFARHVQDITADPVKRAGMFRKYGRQDIGPLVWKSLRPDAIDPFRNDEEG